MTRKAYIKKLTSIRNMLVHRQRLGFPTEEKNLIQEQAKQYTDYNIYASPELGYSYRKMKF